MIAIPRRHKQVETVVHSTAITDEKTAQTRARGRRRGLVGARGYHERVDALRWTRGRRVAPEMMKKAAGLSRC
jgi:hypothetical protein